MSEKLCVFCKHIDMNTLGCNGPYPDPATFECGKGYWQGISGFDDRSFRETIKYAETCKDYREAK